MSTRKKKKLSLKKTTAPKTGSSKPDEAQGQTSILSMFRRQRERQIVEVDSDNDESEGRNEAEKGDNKVDKSDHIMKSVEDAGSEGDVIITRIESSKSDTFINLDSENKKSSNERQGSSRKKLSLRKAKKRKSSDLDDRDEFAPTKTKSKKESNKSISGGDSSARYNLRKSKTDPVIDDSDSEDGITIVKIDDKRTDTENVSSQKENLKSVKDTDTGVLNNETKSNKAKSKLSLKKHKTESDVKTRTEEKVKGNIEKIFVDLSEGSESDNNEDEARKQHASAKCTKTNRSHNQVNINNEKSSNSVHVNHSVLETENQNNDKLTQKSSTCTNKRAEADNGSIGENDNESFQAKLKDCECIEIDVDYDEVKERNAFERHVNMPDTEMKSKAVKESVTTFSIFKQQVRKGNEKKKLLTDSVKAASNVVADNEDSDDDDSKADFLQNVEETTETGTEQIYKVPYYLENFRTILETVLEDEENTRLFDETDMTYITTFHSLDGKLCLLLK